MREADRAMREGDPLEYRPGMEAIESDLLKRVWDEMKRYDPGVYAVAHVERALARERLSAGDFGALLSGAAEPFLEGMAQRAARERARFFGNGVGLFTPLYIANFCENGCVYCGFSCRNRIRRARLTVGGMEDEMRGIAETGLKEILILTGESRRISSPEYIGRAIEVAARFFTTIGLETYPVNVDEYRCFRERGADFVSVYQETYDIERYGWAHPNGAKRCFPYRFHAQERAVLGGMRGVAFGALLGLADWRRDAFAAGMHGFLLQRKYPHTEISFSFPRLRPFGPGSAGGEDEDDRGEDGYGQDKMGVITEKNLLQTMLAYRIFMPYAGLTISTRERSGFRDGVLGVAATKISAGVKVGVGGHGRVSKGDEQFAISDGRSVAEIRAMVAGRGMQCVFNDYIRV